MKKIVMTQEIIDDFRKRHAHRPEKWRSVFICKLCRPLYRANKQGLAEYWQQWPRATFKAGQEVYEVTYPNGTVGYYHVLCMDRLKELCTNDEVRNEQPYYCMVLAEVMRYDVDRWNTVNSFIKPLVEKELGDKQIIEQIRREFDCSYTTAWRRLRDFKARSL